MLIVISWLKKNRKTPAFIKSRVTVDLKTGCWLWNGVPQSGGYGQVEIDGWKLLAHRASWEAHNEKIPNGLLVLHKCDVPLCVNPEHLFLGTQKDNFDDAVKKGRHLGKFPDWSVKKNRMRDLTDDDVRKIRSATGLLKYIADEYGISITHVSQIKNGKRKQLVV